MIQSTLKNFTCKMHQKKIISVCLNQICKQKRLVCFDCLKINEHVSHLNNLDEFENLEKKIKEIQSKQSKLISELTMIIENILTSYQRIKKGINDKYNISFQTINVLDNEELILYIENIISFEQFSEAIQKQIQQSCSDFEQKLQSYLIELHLESLTYLNVSQENKHMAQQLFNQGYALYQGKKSYDRAINYFDQALSYDRNHLDSIWCKGASLKCQGFYKDSLDYFQKALSIDCNHLISLYCMGDSLRMIGQFQDAIQWYDKTLKIDANYVNSLNGKGATLRQMGQYKEALELQQKALAIEPNHKLTLYECGETLRSLNQFSEALTYLDKALSIDQNHWFSLGSKGACLLRKI